VRSRRSAASASISETRAAASCWRFSGGRLPAREGSELEGFAGRILVETEGLAATAGEVLLGAVESPALESLAGGQGLDAVDSRPFLKAFGQIFFAVVGETYRNRAICASGSSLIWAAPSPASLPSTGTL